MMASWQEFLVNTIITVYIAKSVLVFWSMPSVKDMTPKFRWLGLPFCLILSTLWPVYIIIMIISRKKREGEMMFKRAPIWLISWFYKPGGGKR
jgi:hypothetical protein